MTRKGTRKIDPVIERTFGWLRQRGFAGNDESVSGLFIAASFNTPEVVVDVSYDIRDHFADVTIARQRAGSERVPYWARVHLRELLEHAGGDPAWNEMEDGRTEQRQWENVFAQGAALLREVASEQLGGRDLEVLEEIIASRARTGVPGLDYPTSEPWAASQEGLWFLTGVAPAKSVSEAIEVSRTGSATSRASAALGLLPGLALGSSEQASAVERLRELLDDPDADVRRAAASSLMWWDDMALLGRILELLDEEPGDAESPIAAAATFLAIRKDGKLRGAVASALDRFASRGPVPREQVVRLRWRLSDHPPRYPRHIQVWRSGSD